MSEGGISSARSARIAYLEESADRQFGARWIETWRPDSCTVKLVPTFVVDRLPVDWWRPGNLRRVLGGDLHFCDDDHVRSIEWNGRLIGQGREPFPYGHWD
jgi:hypothetical protein